MKKRTTRRIKKTRLPVPRAISRAFPKIRYCVDSDTHVTVTVSKRDCTEGKSNDPQQCAMARALMREHHADGAVVGPSFSYVINEAKREAIRYTTPASVKQELVSFDRHHDFEPGAYHLSPVTGNRRLGAHQSRPAPPDTRARHDTAPRVMHRTARVRQIPGGYDSE